MKATFTRRILAILLTLAMVLALVPAAFASEFSDVPAGAWYEKAVDYCSENGLMKGTGNGFNPNGKVTREMAVQTLFAMAGSPETEYKAIFTDVPNGQWYTPAIMWGSEYAIVAGDGQGHFNVGVSVTREQVAMFFYNYAKFVGMEEDFASLKSFPDGDKVSTWAKTAVQWAVAMGVLSGKDINGTAYLKPQDPLTRAELASILSRFNPIVPEACNHKNTEVRDAKAATCLEAGYTGDIWCLDCDRMIKKGEEIKALGHIDEDNDKFCDRCNEWLGEDSDKVFTLTDTLVDGTEVVIYNPGHGMAIKNETDNNWYLVPEITAPEGDAFIGPDSSIIWTVVDNGDGTFSFVNGDNAIAAWVSGTYIELTNDANYEGADIKWTVSFIDGLAYIGSSTLSNSYGPAYIECYYNANKDKTNISGYTSSNPSGKSNDFGFQFYSFGKVHEHTWDEGKVVAPTCTDDGYTLYTCTKCGATKKDKIVPATGHVDANNDYICDVCKAQLDVPAGDFVLTDALKDGDQVVIYNPGHGMAITNANDNNWYLVPEAITPVNNTIADPADYLIWTVVDNKDGTFSFVNGDNAIVAWLSGTYIELTNDANYAGADGNWIVSWTNGLAYIQSSSLSNSYGPAYIECYYNANKDKTNISGYTSGDPTAKSNDFGFQFYVLDGEPIVPPAPPAGDLPFENEDCVVIYNAANGVIVGYEYDTDYDEATEEYSYCNVTTEDANVDGKEVRVDYMNAGTFYAIIDEDESGETVVGFLDQYDYDYEDEEEGIAHGDLELYLAAYAPDTMYDEDFFYVIAVDGGYLLKSYFDESYLFVKDGLLYAGELIEGDANFIFQFASVDDFDENTDEYICTLLDGGSPIVPPTPPTPTGDFTLSETLNDGDQVVIYNPGHGMAITNANDNNWYLVPEAITPANDTITDPDGKFIWTVVDNGDGTFSFVNGDNAIVAWLSGTYIELTNDANYAGADGKWIVSWTDGLGYIQSSSLSNSYGPAYIECYYNANKDKTNISGYTSGDPTAKSNDFGFQFYVLGGEAPCTHNWEKTGETAATCTEKGSITYTCSLCGATKTEAIPALGHNYVEGVCEYCGKEEPVISGGSFNLASEIKDGDEVVIYNPGYGKAIKNENDNNWYLVAQDIAPVEDVIETEDASLIWTVVENADGTYSFVNGDNAIVAWLSGTYVELTNDPAHAGADTKWNVAASATEGLFYISSSSVSTSYGPGYLECYTKSGTVKVCGYASSSPSDKDFGFQFYVKGGEAPCKHEWEVSDEIAPTCLEKGSIEYTCSLCGKTKTEDGAAATGHVDANNDQICDSCGKSLATGSYTVADSIAVGDKIVLVAHVSDAYYAMSNDTATINNALAGVLVTLDGNKVVIGDETVVWEVCAGSADGTITLKSNDGKFISWSSSTTVTLGATGIDLTATCGEGTSQLLFTSTLTASTVRGLFARDNNGVQFRAYSIKNVATSGYADEFTIYKLG